MKKGLLSNLLVTSSCKNIPSSETHIQIKQMSQERREKENKTHYTHSKSKIQSPVQLYGQKYSTLYSTSEKDHKHEF